MTPKHQLYLTLCDRLSDCGQRDQQMMESDPEMWQQVRVLDEFLVHYGGWTILLEHAPFDVAYQDHEKVGAVQYERICGRLVALYVDVPAMP